MGCTTASRLLQVGVVCALLAALLHAIGFATNAWKVNTVTNVLTGLWQFCNGFGCYRYSTDDSVMLAVRAMETLGLIFVGAAFILALPFLFIDRFRRRSFRNFIILGSLAAVVFITIGVVVFGLRSLRPFEKVHYSFGLSIAGGVFSLFTAVLVFLDRAR